MDRADVKLVLGVLAISFAVIWAALVIGAAIHVARLVGGL